MYSKMKDHFVLESSSYYWVLHCSKDDCFGCLDYVSKSSLQISDSLGDLSRDKQVPQFTLIVKTPHHVGVN